MVLRAISPPERAATAVNYRPVALGPRLTRADMGVVAGCRSRNSAGGVRSALTAAERAGQVAGRSQRGGRAPLPALTPAAEGIYVSRDGGRARPSYWTDRKRQTLFLIRKFLFALAGEKALAFT